MLLRKEIPTENIKYDPDIHKREDCIFAKVRDFTESPGPGLIEDGPNSAEEFRKNSLDHKLEEAIKNNKFLVIDLDGVDSYGPSFIKEIFMGLSDDFGLDSVLSHIKVISTEEELLYDEIVEYLKMVSD